MPTLDFVLARSKHLDWKQKLKSLLNGCATISEAEATSHRHCELGRWLYSEGLKKYESAPSIKGLEQSHEQLHSQIRRIVEMKDSGDQSGAEHEFERVKAISDRVMGLLTQVEKEVGS